MFHLFPITREAFSEGTLSPFTSTQTTTVTHQAAPEDTTTRKPVILLVDDDPDILQLTRAFLEATGYSVLSCSTGCIAAEVFRKTPQIDLLLTDLQLPGISGVELARELTALRPALPVLIVSGAVLTDSLETEMSGRGWLFLAKPWMLTDLLETVHSVLTVAEARHDQGS